MTYGRDRPTRHVFVAGLHRSGTSLLSRLIGAHPDISVIRGSGAPEDEGVYLQGAIPHTARSGIPGRFARDPEQHLVEGGRSDTLETRDRLHADWAPWFDPDARWWLEKSPANPLRMRLYQQLFPMAHFIVPVRHPAIVAQATMNWSEDGEARLVEHWAIAHRVTLGDLDYIHNALILRYEDLCRAPEAALGAIGGFLDLERMSTPAGIAIRDGNADYPVGAAPLPESARRLGYNPDPAALDTLPAHLQVRHVLKSRREAALAALGPRPG